jgi:predicted ATPase/class 3 adenylate cyclase
MTPTEKTGKLLYDSPNSLIYLEKVAGRQDPIIRKFLKDPYPSPHKMLQFNNEYEFTKDLDVPGIRRALSKGKQDGLYVLELEYFDGKTLEKTLSKTLSLEQKLKLGIQIAQVVGSIHQVGIIHKDLTFSNILVSHDLKEITVIDFGLSSKIDLKTTHFTNPDHIVGTLPFMAPEQTGRMNRIVDYRSDLYSLGILLYYTFTGTLPFLSEDALEMVHMHIARSPQKPSTNVEDLPDIFDQIILALLAKNAEERYQSAFGIKKDLEKCLQQLLTKKRINPFKLSDQEFIGKFQIPQKLYGRKKELDTLLEAFDRVSSGSSETLLIGGYSGVGKTALVNEVHKPITFKRGFFIKGKFDQYQRNIPYSGITQAFNEFCEYLLTESRPTLEKFRTTIQDALGDLGQVLVDIVPELELIIGAQPDVEKLEPLESINRFNLVFQRFIRSICLADHPVVMFLDDLQWADPASLNLLKLLVTDEQSAFFLLIGAYRDNEVDPSHPLMITVEESVRDAAVIHNVNLSSLGQAEIISLTRDALRDESETTKELGKLIFNKTGGNAFFTIELMKSLYEEHYIQYDVSNQKWIIDRNRVRDLSISDNVVELMGSKIRHLSKSTQDMIKLASCIGNQFEISTLGVISEKNTKETFEDLWSAIQEGLIVPENEDYRLVTVMDETNWDEEVHFNFLHDRVQQAAYSLIREKDRAATHLRIGRLLLAKSSHVKEEYFDIVNHLNAGRQLIEESQELDQLAMLNYQAGLRARDSTAYNSAFKYLNTARDILGDNAWKKNLELTYSIHQSLAEVYYLIGELDESKLMTDLCLKHANTPSQLADLSYMNILRQTLQNRYDEAIQEATIGLSRLDFDFPHDGLESLIERNMAFLLEYFESNGIETLYDRPDITDELKLATMKILDNLSAPTYVSGKINLWILHVLMKVKLSVEYGNSPEIGYAFSELGLIFCIQGLFQYGFQCGSLSRKLAQKFEKRSLRHKSRSLHLIANYINPWYAHIREIDPVNTEAYKSSLDAGELIYAGYTRFHPHFNYFYGGEITLNQILDKLPAAISFCKKIKHDLAYDSLAVMEMMIHVLSDPASDPANWKSDEFEEKTFLQECESKQDYYGIAALYAYKSCILYLFDLNKEADEYQEKASAMILPLRGNMVHYSNFIFYQCLILLKKAEAEPKKDRVSILKKVDSNLEQIMSWEEPGRQNIEHKRLLIEAERSRVLGKPGMAGTRYLDAIQSAKENSFYQNEALAHELAGRFWLNQGISFYAQPHFLAAHHQYTIWGATALAAKLESEYPVIFRSATIEGSGLVSIHDSGSMGGSRQFNIDLDTVVKSSYSISGELELPGLLDKLMEIVIENAGAQKAALILLQQDNWFVEAVRSTETEETLLNSTPLDQVDFLPVSIIHYVIRTGEEVLINQMEKNNLFARDNYLLREKPQSVMVLPLSLKGKTNGIIYLENKIATNAFTTERTELLYMLSGQMAISLENATLYYRLTELNKAYQKFVPHQFLSTLGHRSILDVKLGDQIHQNMTVFFSDIRSYSSMSEKMTPEENFNFINAYLSRVVPHVERHRGFVNQFTGDGIMALFLNATEALQAAVEIMSEIKVYNKRRIKKRREPIEIGIGMHTGNLMMGIIGDADRHATGVISSVVNIASRIEGLTKIFGSSVILSEATLGNISQSSVFHYRFLGSVLVKGLQEAIKVYECYDGDDTAIKDKKVKSEVDYNEGMEHYFSKDFVSAAASFKRVLNVNPHDRTAERYLKHAAEYIVQGVDSDWTGIEIMTEK